MLYTVLNNNYCHYIFFITKYYVVLFWEYNLLILETTLIIRTSPSPPPSIPIFFPQSYLDLLCKLNILIAVNVLVNNFCEMPNSYSYCCICHVAFVFFVFSL